MLPWLSASIFCRKSRLRQQARPRSRINLCSASRSRVASSALRKSERNWRTAPASDLQLPSSHLPVFSVFVSAALKQQGRVAPATTRPFRNDFLSMAEDYSSGTLALAVNHCAGSERELPIERTLLLPRHHKIRNPEQRALILGIGDRSQRLSALLGIAVGNVHRIFD